jgi:hypothetical protein
VNWNSQAVLVLSIGEDLCPALLTSIEVTDGIARPVFVSAGYLSCEQPLVPYTVIAAVDRSILADVSELEVSAEAAFADVDTVVPVSVTPAVGEQALNPVDVAFGERSGAVPLPPRGETVAGVLDDGTPVFVVHHHDGTISVLDPRGADQNVDGLYQVVRWVAATRNFLGRGAWDEFGRRLDGFRSSDLTGFATRVVDGQVEIGSEVPAPAGSPITDSSAPPAMADRSIEAAPIRDLDEATELPTGATAWVNAVVLSLPDSSSVCELNDDEDSSTEPARRGCPAGSPTADGIAGTPGYVNFYGGPLLATRSPDGFERIAATGGYGGDVL